MSKVKTLAKARSSFPPRCEKNSNRARHRTADHGVLRRHLPGPSGCGPHKGGPRRPAFPSIPRRTAASRAQERLQMTIGPSAVRKRSRSRRMSSVWASPCFPYRTVSFSKLRNTRQCTASHTQTASRSQRQWTRRQTS